MKIRMLSDCEGNEWGCVCVDRMFIELSDGTVIRLTEEGLRAALSHLEVVDDIAVEERTDRTLPVHP